MRVPLSWLREYVSVDLPVRELAHRMDVSIAVVAGIEQTGVPDVDGNLGLYRVGRVLEAGKHPNADRLQLCRVDVGENEPRQIVCGAWNFGAGATVAVALPGAVLPGGTKLERAKLRGEVSDGMILSERELELGHDHSGILVLAGGEPGTPLADVLPLGETILDLEVTNNRPDLLSVYGVARDLAALLRLDLAPPPGRDAEQAVDEPVDVQIEDLEGCPRYIGRLFRDVQVGPSPPWLRARLTAAGMRPISNVVDVTNYVMLGLGNPLHAFDYSKLADGRVVVRRARPGEELRTLDGELRKLDPSDLMIADAERSIALAGIMGGEESEVGEETTEVLLEAANFEPVGIWRTSERLRIRTEGSNRWEKGVDPYLAEQAAVLATELIVELAGARWVGHTDVEGELPERPVVQFRPERADAVIGLEIDPSDQHESLTRLGLEAEDGRYVVPTWRARDLLREIDLVEEVARFELEHVPFTLPLRREMTGRLSREQRLRRRIEDTFVGLGFSEVITPSLRPEDVEENALRLEEPISIELAVLRTELLPSLIEAARRNGDAGNRRIALFEIARVYLPRGDDLPEERTHVAGIVEGGFSRAKGVVEAVYAALKATTTFEPAEHPLMHPGKTAQTESGRFGEVHPAVLEGNWGAFELGLDSLAAAARDPITYEDVITYPAVRQDLAFIVSEDVPAGDLIEAAREAAGAELREMRVFDVYRGPQVGEGRKSIALSVAFQSPERTLSDEDAARLREQIAAGLHERFGAELRAG
ncbi:MAG: phenylalanine--tRNA ligase subunit beta [Actinobacteria bacterium]|nr:phenylalanine--tRNA ligase subunit beta [Actinomycetota bacterium]